MKTINDEVCSIGLAKKLNELGVKQESLFCWCGEGEYIRAMLNEDYDNECNPNYKICSAFTVSELGKLIPTHLKIDGKSWWLNISTEYQPFYQLDCDVSMKQEIFPDYENEDDSEANFRAEMLIHLLENKLMELKND